MITAWRIVATEWEDDAFSGEGSRRLGGRWHTAGTRMVYAAESVALATLELLANTQRARLLRDYVLISCSFPEALVEELDRSLLPPDWDAYPRPPLLQKIGTQWYNSLSSAVLAVPSAVIPEEVNYLINPEHPDFRSIDVGASRPFHIDLRLVT